MNLTPASATPPAVMLHAGKTGKITLAVTNAGNVPGKGKLTLDLFASTDGSLDPAHSFALGSLPAVSVSIPAGGTKKLKLKVTLPAMLPVSFPTTGGVIVVRLTASHFPTANSSDGMILGAIPFAVA